MLSLPGTRTIADVVQMDPVTALAGDRMWHCPCDTGLAGTQVGLESLWIAPERAVHKTVIVKLKLQWRPREARAVRNTGHLLREDSGKEKGQPKREAVWAIAGKAIGLELSKTFGTHTLLTPGCQRWSYRV